MLDETIFHQSLSHQPLETRTAMAYWQNGKCYMHCSTQSTARTQGPAARWLGVDPDDVVLVGEYCGGGFGSKASGVDHQSGIPGLLSQKVGKPVMMRINRQEENFIGRARPGKQARVQHRLPGRWSGARAGHVRRPGRWPLRPHRRLHVDAGDQASLMYHAAQHAGARAQRLHEYAPPLARSVRPGGVQAVTVHGADHDAEGRSSSWRWIRSS